MLDRMLEVKCHDQILKKNRQEQIRHAKDAIYWFLDHLNLTEVTDLYCFDEELFRMRTILFSFLSLLSV